MNEQVAKRWIKFVAVSLWTVTASVVLLSIWHVVFQPYRRQQQTVKLVATLGGHIVTVEAPWWLPRFGNDLQKIVLIDVAQCDDPPKYLESVAALTDLETLVVGGPQFGDEELRRLHGLRSLRGLVLDSTEVTDAGLAEIQQALPEFEVYRSPRRAVRAIETAIVNVWGAHMVSVIGFFIARVIWKSGPPASTFSQPPRLLSAAQSGEAILLFDGKTTRQWKTVGQSTVRDGNLELGDTQPSAAYFEVRFSMDFEVSFDFFQDGPGTAEFRVNTILPDSSDKYFTADLNRSNFVYKRWHHCVAVASYDSGHFSADVDVKPLGDGYGGSSHARFTFPTAGCRCVVGFTTAAKSKLYVRNVVLKNKASFLPAEAAEPVAGKP
jgi:hypothetical protein